MTDMMAGAVVVFVAGVVAGVTLSVLFAMACVFKAGRDAEPPRRNGCGSGCRVRGSDGFEITKG